MIKLEQQNTGQITKFKSEFTKLLVLAFSPHVHRGYVPTEGVLRVSQSGTCDGI